MDPTDTTFNIFFQICTRADLGTVLGTELFRQLGDDCLVNPKCDQQLRKLVTEMLAQYGITDFELSDVLLVRLLSIQYAHYCNSYVKERIFSTKVEKAKEYLTLLNLKPSLVADMWRYSERVITTVKR